MRKDFRDYLYSLHLYENVHGVWCGVYVCVILEKEKPTHQTTKHKYLFISERGPKIPEDKQVLMQGIF